MKSSTMFMALDRIALTASKNEKQALVKQVADQSDDFKRVLEYAYNPFKTYGIKPLAPEWGEKSGQDDFNAGTWELLNLLINRKLTGVSARAAVQSEFNRLNNESAELLWRIIRKDLRADFSESTINKAVKGLIPEFPYMRCSLPKHVDLASWPWAGGIVSQEKADGMFANVDHEIGGVVRITSRQGSEFPIEKFKMLEMDVRGCITPGTQLHGEVIVHRNGVTLPREIGNGILNSVLKGGDFGVGEFPVYQAWDQIPLSAVVSKGKWTLPYRQRLGGIIQQLQDTSTLSIELIPTRIVKTFEGALAHYRELLAKGKEGTVIKLPTATWKDGTSKEQIKMKLEVDVDLKIVGYVEGEGKFAGSVGSVTCRTSDDELEVNVSGFTDKERDWINKGRIELLESIMTVRANSIMLSTNGGKHSLFLPRHVELRHDKVVADSMQQVRDQFESAVRGA